jgi:hypothetical protein
MNRAMNIFFSTAMIWNLVSHRASGQQQNASSAMDMAQRCMEDLSFSKAHEYLMACKNEDMHYMLAKCILMEMKYESTLGKVDFKNKHTEKCKRAEKNEYQGILLSSDKKYKIATPYRASSGKNGAHPQSDQIEAAVLQFDYVGLLQMELKAYLGSSPKGKYAQSARKWSELLTKTMKRRTYEPYTNGLAAKTLWERYKEYGDLLQSIYEFELPEIQWEKH